MKKSREIQHSFVFGSKDCGDEILLRAGWSQHVFMHTDYSGHNASWHETEVTFGMRDEESLWFQR